MKSIILTKNKTKTIKVVKSKHKTDYNFQTALSKTRLKTDTIKFIKTHIALC